MKIAFGGFLLGNDTGRRQLETLIDPDDMTIDRTIDTVGGGDGVLCMRLDPAPDVGPYELVLYSDGGRYLLMLAEVAEDRRANTRTLTNESAQDGFVSILGESYAAKAVTGDLAIVRSAFKEFARRGTVSHGLMS
ncbi:hypothetical protein B0G57_113179 [Trinickia symbiotica]|uniref:Uncharacterized protein n=1 Tax=Trinickia symbiotica TaxID=863227 RepID=A0A2N7WYQ7_9BURK|nr:hypothetical protein [Trinickia symbiotica]PMS34626.1 hypothetical protein C0Z20_21490 [Trinickia symbiotica]PPK43420.1 hypothetical protein B0G57_113179 [Trinickia symbiotica]